jgi:plasmid maintenance system antidote protein VapI/Zn-dependent peptidase ImmA (M78 family)
MSNSIIEIEDLCPPGEILDEALEERGMTGAELARRTGLSEKHVSQLLRAKVPLSTDVALSLEQVLGIPARLWNSMEFNYRAELRRKENRIGLAQFAEWMRSFPVAQMRKCGYFGTREVGSSVADRVEALLQFFGVTTPESWDDQWAFATGQFRKSPSFDPDHFALTAWLRRGEVEGERIRCSAYDESRFRLALEEARKMTTLPADRFVPMLTQLFADAGVALTFVPALPKLAISGVTRWKDPSKALVSLSLRHKTDDQLWFSLFHEACHVLEHKTRTIYIDSPADPNEDPAERRANEFARDMLIPPDRFVELQRTPPTSKAAIKRFATSVDVAPGIVVGQLQHLGLLQRSHCNDLKQRFAWDFEN